MAAYSSIFDFVGILSRPIAFALRSAGAVIAPAALYIANLESFSLMYLQVNTAEYRLSQWSL